MPIKIDEASNISRWALFLIFLRLGLTSFGGPIAHLGYFRAEFVERRAWLTDAAYADLVALCQFLPGPASSQVVMGIGLRQGGVAGAMIASLGFTLPSLLLMLGFGVGVLSLGDALGDTAWIHALKLVAVAVVAQAIWGMARQLCPDRERASIALAGAALLVAWPSAWGQLLVILVGAMLGWLLCRHLPTGTAGTAAMNWPLMMSARMSSLSLLLFVALLLLSLWILTSDWGRDLGQDWQLLAAMYKAGALVFGGGHVLLPLLEAETVAPGWVSQDIFLAGYGAAQALPGPLFAFAGFIGLAQAPTAGFGAWGSGVLATVAIFLPSFLLLFAVLPLWTRLSQVVVARAALAGVNAAVVGLLIAAFYDPVWISAVQSGWDLAFALIVFALLQFWRVPAWSVVIGATCFGALIGILV